MNNVPNVIIAGVNKAATTSLFMYLAQHPDICPSSIKEVSHFDPVRYGNPAPPVDNYWQYFDKCVDQTYRLEATGGYYYAGAPMAAEMKKQLGGDIRLIFIFREPIARALSFFRFQKSRLLLENELTFAQYVDQCLEMTPEALSIRENNPYWGVNGGAYMKWFDDWTDAFEPSQIKIVFFEHFRKDTPQSLREICEWLNIDSESYLNEVVLTMENKTMDFRVASIQRAARFVNEQFEGFWRANPKLKRLLRSTYYSLNGRKFEDEVSPATRARLHEYYSPYNQRLAQRLHEIGYTNVPSWLSE